MNKNDMFVVKIHTNRYVSDLKKNNIKINNSNKELC